MRRPDPTIRGRGRSGRPWERAKAHVRATQPACWLCGYLIDLTLDRTRHPLGSTVDHMVPLHYGGPPLDPTSLAHCHRVCNTSKGTKPATPEVRARCRQLVEMHLGKPAPSVSRVW